MYVLYFFKQTLNYYEAAIVSLTCTFLSLLNFSVHV